MFVPFKPYMAFDVYRDSTTCVCGDESPHQRGEKRGYCPSCYAKKKEFIAGVVGSIPISNIYDVNLRVLEEMRVKMMSDRISFMIDSYYAEGGTDPYDDVDFIIRCYYDKSQVLTSLHMELDSTLSQVASYRKGPFASLGKGHISPDSEAYFRLLSRMNNNDQYTIKELHKARGAVDDIKELKYKRVIEENNNDGN